MTYEKPEQPPPLMPSRTAAFGVPRCASFLRAKTAAAGAMLMSARLPDGAGVADEGASGLVVGAASDIAFEWLEWRSVTDRDRKSKRLNSSHQLISYAR